MIARNRKIAGSVREFEIVIKRRLPKWCNTELCRLSSERQRKCALDLSILVVDQHNWRGSSGAGFYRGLPKTQVNPYCSKCVAHVIAKVRVEFQLFHVAKMIRSITCRITAGEINKVQHARVMSIGAPIFRSILSAPSGTFVQLRTPRWLGEVASLLLSGNGHGQFSN